MPRDPRKADLIRSLPRDMPFRQVQQHVRKAGLGSIAKSYVQKVRSEMPRPKNGHSQKANGHAPTADDRAIAAQENAPPELVKRLRETAVDNKRDEFFQLMVVLGTARVRQMLSDYETVISFSMKEARRSITDLRERSK